MVTMAMTVAIVTYCLWAFESNTAAGDGAVLFEVSIVPLVAAFMRYLLVLDMGRGAAPEEVFAGDRVLQALGAVWVVVYGLAVYL
jgi:decaprenyl-phosphate phosphoribosyltransferase